MTILLILIAFHFGFKAIISAYHYNFLVFCELCIENDRTVFLHLSFIQHILISVDIAIEQWA